jgi:hypothetical protein
VVRLDARSAVHAIELLTRELHHRKAHHESRLKEDDLLQ